MFNIDGHFPEEMRIRLMHWISNSAVTATKWRQSSRHIPNKLS